MVAAILLLGILLFNWVGYRVLNDFMQDRANRQLESRLDHREYDESRLISIKVPVKHLSYYNNSVSFERVDGQIEINGIPYKYVKRRIYNDSVELLCIPNETALALRTSRDDYFNIVNDIQRSPGQSEHSHPGSSKTFLTDPYTLASSFQLGDRPFRLVKAFYYFFVSLPFMPPSTGERPPIRIA